MKSGIYLIRNLINGKIYVGSSVDVRRRFAVHRCYLRSGKHSNRHLQSAWDQYGEAAFEMSHFLCCARVDLVAMEQVAIEQLQACDAAIGYNIRREATGFYGWKPSAEHVRKMHAGRAAKFGYALRSGPKPARRPHPALADKILSLAERNAILFADPEHGSRRRAAIAAALKGKPKSLSHRAALKAAWEIRRAEK